MDTELSFRLKYESRYTTRTEHGTRREHAKTELQMRGSWEGAKRLDETASSRHNNQRPPQEVTSAQTEHRKKLVHTTLYKGMRVNQPRFRFRVVQCVIDEVPSRFNRLRDAARHRMLEHDHHSR